MLIDPQLTINVSTFIHTRCINHATKKTSQNIGIDEVLELLYGKIKLEFELDIGNWFLKPHVIPCSRVDTKLQAEENCVACL